jgi:hypothetical protein
MNCECPAIEGTTLQIATPTDHRSEMATEPVVLS